MNPDCNPEMCGYDGDEPCFFIGEDDGKCYNMGVVMMLVIKGGLENE